MAFTLWKHIRNHMFEKVIKLMENPTPLNLWILNKLLRRAIPFNIPHGLDIKSLHKNKVEVDLPYKHYNWNHLKGQHACAIATVGEYCAGLNLILHFNPTQYRYLLMELKITYHKQGKSRLTGISQYSQNLEAQEILTPIMISDIYNDKQELVAQVESKWQIKKWDLLKK